MGEDSLKAIASTTAPSDRKLEQAIVALKKGAQLLKYRRSGKPKFYPFRLSSDGKILTWYSGSKERQLRLDSITKIIPGTVCFQRQPQPGRDRQSFSIIYANGEHSLDLMCKDEGEAESWMLGLTLVSKSLTRPMATVKTHRSAKSCVNSPLGYTQRKYNLGVFEDPTEFSQVRSLCGSPQSLTERCLSDGLSCSSDNIYSSEPRTHSNVRSATESIVCQLLPLETDIITKKATSVITEKYGLGIPVHSIPSDGDNYVPRDVLMWGEGIGGGSSIGGFDKVGILNGKKIDALLPKVLESTALLDVKNISFGGKHVSLVTRQGEVFCWGEENGGRLGHKVNMDVSYPKVVDSLDGLRVEFVSCGEYNTCAVTFSGELYSWGDSCFGIGLTVDGSKRSQWLPHKVSGPFDGIHVSSVACGDWHTAVVSSSGQLFTYGDGTFGVLGHGDLQSYFQPKEVDSLKGLRVKCVACGPWHTAAVVDIMVDHSQGNSPCGKLFTWGDGDEGRLGHLDHETKLFPTCVAQLVDHDFVQVSCARMLTVGLTNTGMVCTMGSAVHGQLGNPHTEHKSISIVEGMLKGEIVKNISSGSYHIAALTSKGRVYTWGKGANGQLGLGDTKDRYSPTLVDSLRDRQVESVVCGSNFTAVICLHKSIFSTDQSTCSGCKMVFGFTRKKRNCYNCGLLFCRACSSKKALNASLTLHKSKPCHVCDTCFNKLTKFTNSKSSVQRDSLYPRQSLILSDMKINTGEARVKQAQLLSPKLSGYDSTKLIGGKTIEKNGRDQILEDHVLPSSSTPLRWGQVACPVIFSTGSVSTGQLSVFPMTGKVHCGSNSVEHLMGIGNDISESDKMLTEVQQLRAEAVSLEKQSLMRSERIQQNQQRIEESWSLAREEAAKCKVAKEIIKALTTEIYALSVKKSAGKDTKVMSLSDEGLDMPLPQIKPISTDASALKNVDPMLSDAHLSPEVVQCQHMQINDLCSSPIHFRDTVPSYRRDHCNVTDEPDESSAPRADFEQNMKMAKSEWVEQDEPGVYITLMSLPSGEKGLKRVRFSRKRFSEKEAARWWKENQVRVYEKYDIEVLSSQCTSQTRS